MNSPVDLKVLPDGTLVVVSITAGEVRRLPLGGVVPPPLPVDFVATASITCTPGDYIPGYSLITCAANSNVAGREGGVFKWVVLLLTTCAAQGAGTCEWTYLFETVKFTHAPRPPIPTRPINACHE